MHKTIFTFSFPVTLTFILLTLNLLYTSYSYPGSCLHQIWSFLLSDFE